MAQEGKLYERYGKFYVRYRATEDVNGKPVRVQKSHCLGEKGDKFYSLKSKALKDARDVFIEGVNERERRLRLGNAVSDEPAQPAYISKKELVALTKDTPQPEMRIVDFWDKVYEPQMANRLKRTTQKTYRDVWKRPLRDHFGDTTLRAYDTPRATMLITELAERGLGKWTIGNVRTVGSALFAHAAALGLVADNPWTNAKILVKVKKAEPTHHYTTDDMPAMLHALEHCTVLHKQKKVVGQSGKLTTIDVSVPHGGEEHGHPEGAVLLGVCFYLALRPHEAIALHWEDYEDKMMRIHRGYTLGKLDTNKTEDDVWIPVVDQLAAMLDRWHKDCGEPKSGFILKNKRNDNPVNLNSLYRRFMRPCFEEKGLKWGAMYAGRRGGATSVVDLTGGNKEVAKMLLRHKGRLEDTQVLDAHYNKHKARLLAAGMKAFETAMKEMEAEDANMSG